MEVSSTSKPPVQQAPPPKRVDPTQEAQQRKAEAPKPAEPPKQAEAKPRPVVNTQGQTIGTKLNVTA